MAFIPPNTEAGSDSYEGEDPPINEGLLDFELGTFRPFYYPEVRDTKERNLKKTDTPCAGQHLADNGAKNLTLHVTGLVLGGYEMGLLREIANAGEKYNLVSERWTGEVMVEQVQTNERVRWDGKFNQWQFQYTIDCTATARDDQDGNQSGVLEPPSSLGDVTAIGAGRPGGTADPDETPGN